MKGGKDPSQRALVDGQMSATTSTAGGDTERPYTAIGTMPPRPSPKRSVNLKDAKARAGVELNVLDTDTANATVREASVKKRERKDKVGEGKVKAGLWSYITIYIWQGVEIPPSSGIDPSQE